jgi:hypothetical protein
VRLHTVASEAADTRPLLQEEVEGGQSMDTVGMHQGGHTEDSSSSRNGELARKRGMPAGPAVVGRDSQVAAADFARPVTGPSGGDGAWAASDYVRLQSCRERVPAVAAGLLLEQEVPPERAAGSCTDYVSLAGHTENSATSLPRMIVGGHRRAMRLCEIDSTGTVQRWRPPTAHWLGTTNVAPSPGPRGWMAKTAWPEPGVPPRRPKFDGTRAGI